MIRLYPDPILRRRAQPVDPTSQAAKQAIQRLQEAFAQVEGLGLAANQVGELVRVILVILDGKERVLLNPRVVWRSEELEVDSEGCLSLPGVEAEVARPKEIRVAAQQETGKPVELALEELEARLLLHEIDHLDGVLYIDHLSQAERRRVLKEYKARRAESEA
ncbi:MAG TPA: peptide deformylase, partial [Candidatus Acetothermia bacterium]|nr:peptide deformylase [Candidatus Acetothermia bacterium]